MPSGSYFLSFGQNSMAKLFFATQTTSAFWFQQSLVSAAANNLTMKLGVWAGYRWRL